MSDLANLIRREVEKILAGRKSKRYGICTSYDPKTHRAKVTFQPEGNESDWLPIHSHHMGSGFGIVVGLTPGDGKSTGDLVEVSFQEGDYESGAITSRVHSDAELPPEVQAGEILVKDKSGAEVRMKDGKISVKSINSHITVEVPAGKFVYLGGDGTGNYDFVATVSGPAKNTKALKA